MTVCKFDIYTSRSRSVNQKSQNIVGMQIADLVAYPMRLLFVGKSPITFNVGVQFIEPVTDEDGQAKLSVRIDDDTVWLTQEQMAELFNKSKSTINEHIQNVYDEKELDKSVAMSKFGNSEFPIKPTMTYIES